MWNKLFFFSDVLGEQRIFGHSDLGIPGARCESPSLPRLLDPRQDELSLAPRSSSDAQLHAV